jgi:hypothetical protein
MRARHLVVLIVSNAVLVALALASLFFAGLSEHLVHSQHALEAATEDATANASVYVRLFQRNAVWVLNQWIIFSCAFLVSAVVSLVLALSCRTKSETMAQPGGAAPMRVVKGR